jgi:two-component system NtrC family sensor kinase
MARAPKRGGRKAKAKASAKPSAKPSVKPKTKVRKASAAKGRKAAVKKRAATSTRKKGGSVQARLVLKTRELNEALAQQVATAEILRVIASSPSDVQPVFEAIVQTAVRLLGCDRAFFMRVDGHVFTPVAAVSRDGPTSLGPANQPVDAAVNFPSRAIATKKMLYLPDWDQIELPPYELAIQKRFGVKCSLFLPLLRGHDCIGLLALVASRPHTFGATAISLAESFRDQAVIAIENARLFNETREALERQTATAEVLKIISTSPAELTPVFDAILANAVRLCDAKFGMLFLFEEDEFRAVGKWNLPPAYSESLSESPIRANPNIPMGRVLTTKQPVHVADVLTDQSYIDGYPGMTSVAHLGGARTLVQVPLLKEDELVGTIAIYRQEVRPFDHKQIDLVQNFASQAVIAIENVRLFDEVQARTLDLEESLQQQMATSEVLQVISSSPSNLAPVFENMLKNATLVCGAEFGSMNLLENGSIRQAALYNPPAAFAAVRVDRVVYRAHPQSSLGEAIDTRQVVHVADLRTTVAYRERWPNTVELVELGGARTVVVVPLLREDEVIGVITIFRQEVRPFEDKQIELVRNFARQAVIAIENARLLGELRQRTADLSKSLDDLRTAQDRLVQTEKLASLGQLTAGIAHEIKNPLNFVNNFSSLSAELVDELDETLAPAPLDEKMRSDVGELTGMLKSNLEKVVAHGKRADSIVKNMLQHSREGSGERRSADINALVEESLNLAYHGARAEKAGFAITLRPEFDPDAGAAKLYPQEITRALLNLIGNGFYAAIRRKAESGDGSFEPVLSAFTRNLGNAVEIRIRDNGTGIPPEVREKMFNPFFTTKPTGEGTGLGLSMTHDIIVKQHGGQIDVETEPGVFTEFIVTLPRDKALR